MFTITVTDDGIQSALKALAAKTANMRPIFQEIGEDIMERAKQRFATGTGPDGARWAPNSRVTIERFLAAKARGKKDYFFDRGPNAGRATAESAGVVTAKRPLIGHSGDLRRQFKVDATNASVTIGNSMIYAAIQQFGGTRAQFPHLWGDIPARPFLPIFQNGQLYPAEKQRIVEALNAWLAR